MTVKQLPSPSLLCTSIVPSSKTTNFFTIDNPKPKPSSPCAPDKRVNSWKIRSRSSVAIPFPVSEIAIVSLEESYLAVNAISPFGVNFTALDKRLFTICRSRKGSLMYLPFNSWATWHCKVNPLAAVNGSKLTWISSNNCEGLKVTRFTSALLRSSRWKSSKSLTNFKRCSEELFILSR